MTTHLPVNGSERVPLPGSVAKGRPSPYAQLDVTLKLRRRAPLPELNARPDGYMSRADLGERFGASEKDAKAIEATLAKFGLETVEVNLPARSLRVRGPTSAIEQAFDVKLIDYAHADGDYRGRIGPVHVPGAIGPMVEGVFGLDNRRVAHRRRHPKPAHTRAHHAAIKSSWYTPAELATHYNFPPGDGAGQAVGILEFGGGYFADDLAQFCQLAKVAAPPKVIAVSTDGTPTDARDGAEGEVMLDVEVVAGLCPKADIVLYFAQFTEQGWITAIDAAVHDQTHDCGTLSVSWGYAELADVWTKQAMIQVNEALKEAALVGMTVCVAAGDDGSSDGVMDGHAHADFPASSPYALAVGGTTIPKKGGTQPDVCWKEGSGLRSDGVGSTGGGPSAVFPAPDWQKAVAVKSVNPGAILGRCTPDIAANADWTASPYLLVVDGQSQGNGGTSAATPLLAGLITRINAKRGAGKRVGYLTPLLYQPVGGAAALGAQGCRDVQTGDNITAHAGGYKAGAGYDPVCGWGTPDGAKLAGLIP